VLYPQNGGSTWPQILWRHFTLCMMWCEFRADTETGRSLSDSTSTAAPPRLRQWTCDICRKRFSQNSSYKNHRRTHSDERPFICAVCSIGFKERYHLKKHTLFKHTSETREQCRVCGKRFKGSRQIYRVTSSIGCFYFLVFLFYISFRCRFRAVD